MTENIGGPGKIENKIENKETYEKGLKIVVGGAPHSGKSVFLDGLLKNLPYNTHYFSACPDGEGPWLQRHYTEDEVKALRRKGQFSDEYVNFASNSVKKFDGELMLIDIGGRTSKENENIVAGATHAIVLASKTEQFEEWINFFNKLKIKVIAELHSDYNGKNDSIETPKNNGQIIKGVVHFLERGEHPENRETIKFVAQKIGKMVEENEKKKNNEKKLPDNIMEVAKLEKEFDLKAHYDKETVPKSLTSLQTYLEKTFSNNKELKIDGRVNSYLSVFLGLELSKKNGQILFNSPDGYVAISKLSQKENGDFLKWENEISDSATGEKINKVNFLLDPSKPLKPEDLEKIKLPSVPKNSIVSIGGKGPHWLRTSVAMGYESEAKVICTFIPGEGSVIVFTKDQEKYPLGTLLQ